MTPPVIRRIHRGEIARTLREQRISSTGYREKYGATLKPDLFYEIGDLASFIVRRDARTCVTQHGLTPSDFQFWNRYAEIYDQVYYSPQANWWTFKPDEKIRQCLAIAKLGNFTRNTRILDFGCGPGHDIALFQEMGFRKSFGIDISESAIAQRSSFETRGHLEVFSSQSTLLKKRYDWVLALDLLEHISDFQLFKIFALLRNIGTHLFVIIPSLADERDKAGLEYVRKAPDHTQFRTRSWWQEMFGIAPFSREQVISLTGKKVYRPHCLYGAI